MTKKRKSARPRADAKPVSASERADAKRIGAVPPTKKKAAAHMHILSSLVQGIHPLTAEELPGDSVCQEPVVIRAILAAQRALEEKEAREARRAALPANIGNPWTADDEQQLVQAFQRRDSLPDIAQNLGRTMRAIETRLVRLGLMTLEQRKTTDVFGANS
ncbi:MAG: hypothetical protein ACJ8R9_05530 [Steroidobacteraceae bacterium]